MPLPIKTMLQTVRGLLDEPTGLVYTHSVAVVVPRMLGKIVEIMMRVALIKNTHKKTSEHSDR